MHERELRFGGGFVRSDAVLLVFSAVRISFELPDGSEVEVGGRVVNIKPTGFFVQFDPGVELDALESAVSFVTEFGAMSASDATPETDTTSPLTMDESSSDGDAEPESESPFGIDGDELDDFEFPDEEASESEPTDGPPTAFGGPVRPAWELIDLGSDVPIHKQISELKVAERIRLARHATRPVRRILVHDTEKRIHVEVVKNPKVGLDEVTEYANLTSLSPLALRWIAKQRRYIRIKLVVMNMILNPNCPPDVALSLLSKLSTPELQRVARSPRVRENIQRAAKKKLALAEG